MESKHSESEMTPMVSSINSLVKKGYTEDYSVNDKGLIALKSGKIYGADEVKVVDFHRFEGSSDPGDESILYAIETDDGGKGTLVDAFGHSSDADVTNFMKKVEEMSKKIKGKNVKNSNMNANKLTQELYSCSEQCNACYRSCLEEPGKDALLRCIMLDKECLEICRLTGSLLETDSENVNKFIKLCAEICNACAEECMKHGHDHCRKCAEACRKCAEMCEQYLR